jgi:phospholipase C
MSADPIEHVVVLMLENRSFDQVLGDCRMLYGDLDGVDRARPKTNQFNGVTYRQKPTTVRCASHDPDHELSSVLRQIGVPAPVIGTDCRRRWWFILLYIAILKGIWSWLRNWSVRLIGFGRGRLRAPRLRMYEGHFVGEYVRKFPSSSSAERDEVMGYYEFGSLPAIHELARHFTICDR